MYEESACFDPNTMQEGPSQDGFSQNPSFSMAELSYHQNPPPEAATTMEVEFHQQMGLDMATMESCYNTNSSNNIIDSTHLMQEVVLDSNHVLSYDHSNWDPNLNPNHHHHQDLNHHVEIPNGHHPNLITHNSSIPDLLNLLHLPRCSPSSVLANSSLSFLSQAQKSGNFPPSFLGDFALSEPGSVSNLVYDPLFHLNLPPQPPLFRELFQSLPNGALFGGGGGGVVDEREGNEGGRQFDNGVLEFSREWDMNCMAKEGNGKGPATKHFPTEKQRRVHLNGKFTALRNLVPNPTKTDRASIVGDAIEYIKELLRTVNELKILVEKKRCGRDRSKRHKKEDGTTGDLESVNTIPDPDQSYNGPSLRSSWLQRKSKDTEVDVRIIDDEVNIKLAQRKKINCLLIVSKVLDELQLDIHHVAGGLVGDNYSFLFNSKICEGSSVYASAIANKLIEVVNQQYAAIPPSTSSY
ncbi:transcription factor bHLH91-like [Actinidia eriantha]|uniref:transcription factor bHLH91-like n=1 Tax=Actinidia eriantha TaxID=165200 RepID=UPI00258D7021|nr:transcription factor bHLH91-like [Actinidia eriantha]XP_057512212.1 transcription factor bHLH91-like [Actinidia eriantha]